MTGEERPEPVPAEIRALMVRADELQRAITDLAEQLYAQDDTRHTSYRVGEAASEVRRARSVLDEAALDLARTRKARDTSLCGVPWGACPLHGATLCSSGGRSWCTESGCSHTWGYDRLGNACGEPVTHTIADREGKSVRACNGHAVYARKSLEGGIITPITEQ
ncbi:hypothetical protein ACFV42_23625 [Streptomyces solisilvae]|uniref:hypothetical protein n=1 Tax=Streptomyces malaysiensis TaxID=92644 RepID=UPI003696266C